MTVFYGGRGKHLWSNGELKRDCKRGSGIVDYSCYRYCRKGEKSPILIFCCCFRFGKLSQPVFGKLGTEASVKRIERDQPQLTFVDDFFFFISYAIARNVYEIFFKL